MRIAMLGHKRMPSREGGVEVVVEELATRMVKLGHDVTVYSRKGHNVAGSEFDDPLFEQEEYMYKGVKVKQVPTLDIKGMAAFTSSYSATKAAIADKPDVIHFHAEGSCAMINLAKKAGIKTIATIHGLDWQREKWGKVASKYIKYGEKSAANKADEVIVLSRSVQDYFRREYGRETRFIPNGVCDSVALEPNIIKLDYGLEQDSYILFLGRIVPEKRVLELIEAFKMISTDMKLVIAGGSSDTVDYFEKVKKAALEDGRILFTGFVQGEELAELYSNAAIFVLPSSLEGMPMSLLEAMSYGCCCLTSDIPECVTVLDNYGVTFAKDDSNDLRKKLSCLINDSHFRRSFGDSARKHVQDKYNWDKIVEDTLLVYRGNNG